MQPRERFDPPTMEFEVWPIMVLLEGPAQLIGQLLVELYDNSKIDRTRWTVDHKMNSRRSYGLHLQKSGMTRRRQGIGLRDELLLRVVQLHCVRLQIACHVFGKSVG
jgi:hypothetical protein